MNTYKLELERRLIMFKLKDYIFIIFIVGIAIIVFISTKEHDKLLAFIGAITALVTVVFTTIVNNNRISLEREKIQLQVTENITKDTYKNLFNKKIQLYQELNIKMSEHYNKVNSAIFDEPYIENGELISNYPTEETIFMEDVGSIIKLLKDNELLVSKDIYAYYETLNIIYLEIKKQLDIFTEFETFAPDDYYEANKKYSELFHENAESKFKMLQVQLEKELDLIRDKIEF